MSHEQGLPLPKPYAEEPDNYPGYLLLPTLQRDASHHAYLNNLRAQELALIDRSGHIPEKLEVGFVPGSPVSGLFHKIMTAEIDGLVEQGTFNGAKDRIIAGTFNLSVWQAAFDLDNQA